ncbi:hypothetical protein EVAR_66777_1 [Eumeta japonica]|uniref:Uncharacterized protein n=1 Tax=Eumeta variegata TaxID=151549 RepID=A0A4C1ZRK5_EUMVA|nr:hypothetical protein EVAR_66777_1 [Eumeta japonica]
MCKNKKLIAPKHVSVIDEEFLNNLKDEDILNRAALILRKSVLQMEKKKLPNNLSVQDLKKRYPGIEELETEATYYSMLKSTICPDAIKTSSNLCTGIAFDNYDRFVETNDGKDTLHDTVGIIYQNIDPNISQESDTPNLPSSSSEEPGTSGKRRRRTMEITELEERPYMKTQDDR